MMMQMGQGRALDDRSAGEEAEIRSTARYDRYLAYRKQQVSALLSIIPREAIRPLYQTAREWSKAEGVHVPKDPLASLSAYCDQLLPLPPFDQWIVDYDSHRLAYMEALAGALQCPVEPEPVAVAVRVFEPVEQPTWYATLVVGHDGENWRGYLQFHCEESDAHHLTTEIFIERHLDTMKERFLDFSDATLQAFHASTRP